LFKNKGLIVALFLLFLGLICLFIEQTFYQYIDAQGWLHESLCLPIGAFSLALGSFGLIIYLILLIINLIKRRIK
jgi:hypothetical protein